MNRSHGTQKGLTRILPQISWFQLNCFCSLRGIVGLVPDALHLSFHFV